MEERFLQRTQKNFIFDLIKTRELDPADFHWATTILEREIMGESSATASQLIHTSSNYYCVFDLRSTREFRIKFTPGRTSPVQYFAGEDWDRLAIGIAGWLSFLKRELDAPDLWSTIFSKNKLLEETIQYAGSGEFSADEKRLLSSGIEQVGSLVKTITSESSIDAGILSDISKKLDLLDATLENSSRDVWVQTAIGVLVSISIAIGPGRAQDFFTTAFNLLFQKIHQLASILRIPLP